MKRYKYRVCGWRYRHAKWPTWCMVAQLPAWMVRFIKREPKRAKEYWSVERVYHRIDMHADV